LLDVGLRSSITHSGVFIAPRISVGINLSPKLTFASAYDRRHQFSTELEEPREGSGKQPLFFLTQPRVADVAAVSLTHWSERTGESENNSFEAVIFSKRYRDKPVIELEDQEGPIKSRSFEFPKFQSLRANSHGASLSINRILAKKSLIQGSYTYQRVRDITPDGPTPTSWDAPHSVSLFGRSNINRNWSVNTTVLAHSGPAITPVAARILAPSKPTDTFLFSRYLMGRTNSSRLPGYGRVDIGVQRHWGRHQRTRVLSIQVLNILGRKNALEWDWTTFFCTKAGVCEEPAALRRGLPIIPTINFEAHW
jgi:hypothetical protein